VKLRIKELSRKTILHVVGGVAFACLAGLWVAARSQKDPISNSSHAHNSEGKRQRNTSASGPNGGHGANQSSKSFRPANSGKIDPSEAKELLLSARDKFSDITERSKYCAEIIQRLCEAGYTAEAWELIDDGAGQVRNFELSAFFKRSGLSSSEALTKMGTLEYRTDYQVALNAYCSSLSIEKLQTLLSEDSSVKVIGDLAKQSKFPDLFSNALKIALESKFGEASKPELKELFGLAGSLSEKKVLSQSVFYELLSAADALDPFEKWDLAAPVVGNDMAKSSEKIRNEIVESMIGENAPDAMSRMIKSPGEQGLVDVQTALAHWYEIDSAAATDWYYNQSPQLSAQQADGATLAFFSSAILHEEFDTAVQWAERIKDVKLREQAIKVAQNKLAGRK
jgi:hypothetical protein